MKYQYKADFRQLTAMSVSGNEITEEFADHWFFRDGLNRLTVPGTSIAGLFIQTAADLGLLTDPELYQKVTLKGKPVGKYAITSHVTFHHMHLKRDVSEGTDIRQMVSLNSKTRSAEPKALFSLEVTPVDTIWNLYMETEAKELTDTIEKVLSLWSTEGSFIGSLQTRGLGRFRLEKVTKNDKELKINKEIKLGFILPYTIDIGSAADDYGIDSLHIGASDYSRARFTREDYQEDISSFGTYPVNNTDVDFLFLCDRLPVNVKMNGTPVPVIPGASIKGALRFQASLDSRWEEADVLDVFGDVDKTTKESKKGGVMFPELTAEEGFVFAYFERHAEDEFAAGPYESSKFNQIDVLEGCFSGELAAKGCSGVEKLKKLKELIEALPGNELMLGAGGRFAVMKCGEVS